MSRRRAVVIVLIVLAVVLASCAGSSSTSSTATTYPLVEDETGTPVPDVTRQADEEFRAVPDGYADCGSTNLASGWPTTTAFFTDPGATCIIEAATAGEPSQQVFYGRDADGGIQGWIYRVQGPGDITLIEYYVDVDGEITSEDTACVRLGSSFSGLPPCETS